MTDTTQSLDHLLNNINPTELEKLIQKMLEEEKERRKTCPHEDVYRIGPSYMPRLDGSWNKHDFYLCKKCGYSSDKPLVNTKKY